MSTYFYYIERRNKSEVYSLEDLCWCDFAIPQRYCRMAHITKKKKERERDIIEKQYQQKQMIQHNL